MKSIVRVTFAAGIFASLLTALGCSSAPSSDPSSAVGTSPKVQVVDASDIKALASDDTLTVDVSNPEASARFDSAKGAIDFTRVTLIEAGNHVENLDQWLAEYATNAGTDLRNVGEFELSSEGVTSVDAIKKAPMCFPDKCCALYAPGSCNCRIWSFC